MRNSDGKLLLLALLVGSSGLANAGNLVVGQNAKQFGILCRIYRVASAPPGDLHVLKEIDAIEAKIDQINVSLSDDAWYEGLKEKFSKEKISQEEKSPTGGGAIERERYLRAIRKVIDGAVKKLPSSNPLVKRARLQIGKIEKQAGNIAARVRGEQLDEKIGQVKSHFRQALLGTLSEEDLKTGNLGLGSNRATDCGKTNLDQGAGKGDKAGTSLLVDFLCLCAYKTSELDKVCGEDVATGAVTWNSGKQATAKAAWDKIEEICKKRVGEGAGATEGAIALDEFAAAIAGGAHGGNDGAKPGLFGNLHSASAYSGGCSGHFDESNHGICVFYGTGATEGVTWYAKMRTGIQHLRELQNMTSAIRDDITHLEMLQTRAEEIYETTQATVELEQANSEAPGQTQNQRQNPNFTLSTPTEKANAKQPDAVSLAPIPRFTLPWTLLI